MSILLEMDWSETVRCFGTHEKALWNIILYKERYKKYLRHGTVQVLDFDEYGPDDIRDTFGSFYHVYIIGDGSIGNCEMLCNSWKGIVEYYFIHILWYGRR